MFIRFVVNRTHDDSGKRQGIFQTAYALWRTLPSGYEADRLGNVLAWFNASLARPTRLTRSRRPHRKAQAICWFKRDARYHLARAHEMRHILEAHGIAVEMITTRRPGFVVYQDDVQVAAYPFSDTIT